MQILYVTSFDNLFNLLLKERPPCSASMVGTLPPLEGTSSSTSANYFSPSSIPFRLSMDNYPEKSPSESVEPLDSGNVGLLSKEMGCALLSFSCLSQDVFSWAGDLGQWCNYSSCLIWVRP